MTEVVFTAIFVVVILGITDRRAPKGFAALAIGLTLTMIHLATIPVTGTSVNPAALDGPGLHRPVGRRELANRAALAVLGGSDHRRTRGSVAYGFVSQDVGGAAGRGRKRRRRLSRSPRRYSATKVTSPRRSNRATT